jgi:hypothetical protein
MRTEWNLQHQFTAECQCLTTDGSDQLRAPVTRWQLPQSFARSLLVFPTCCMRPAATLLGYFVYIDTARSPRVCAFDHAAANCTQANGHFVCSVRRANIASTSARLSGLPSAGGAPAGCWLLRRWLRLRRSFSVRSINH